MNGLTRAVLAAGLVACGLGPAAAQTAPAAGNDAVLLTVFLKHDQSKNLHEINAQLQKNGYYDQFPPAGTEVVSWYVVMGIGQVVTLRVPPAKLRDVNVALENTAWGPYRTEFYPTYDYKALAEEQKRKLGSGPKAGGAGDPSPR
ncbi:conserved hypothetical protein [Methylobacterium sp. 4-46]|uniref:hypothetical protein n=1 Tax=unclassified Methylobacterium TaxID=2615210 RepID=UPI000152CBBA|nr:MULTISPECIES: hypothetical protein [Methylobacterium]ACA18409.1 conserved hypothetical protein [Methylobacterium sp. 4-46]WFT77698.1 hypothetical protein QA634_20560 [Methylobacterium nodulans]